MDQLKVAQLIKMGASDILLILLLCYFLLMNATVERYYCHEGGPFSPSDTRFLVKETIDFSVKFNPLFLSRPEWMVKATCVSAYVLSIGYLFIMGVTLFGAWRQCRTIVMLFLGAKLYAIGFYHLMEFTSPDIKLRPQHLVPYFAVEGPYVLSMLVTFAKCTFLPKAKVKKD
jgi:hypothetical protein